MANTCNQRLDTDQRPYHNGNANIFSFMWLGGGDAIVNIDVDQRYFCVIWLPGMFADNPVGYVGQAGLR